MTLANHIEISRLWLLLKMEWLRNKNGLLLTFAVTFGLLLIGDLTSPIFEKQPSGSHEEDYAFTLLVLGFVLSSLAFKDLKNNLRRHHYLMLPASTFEKFLSMWVLTSFGWLLAFTLPFQLYSWISNAVCSLIYRNLNYPPFVLFSEIPLNAIRSYLVLQTIFLLGAVQFRGYAFLKTLLALLVLAIILAIVAYYSLSDMFDGTDYCLDNEAFWNNTGICCYYQVLQGLFWFALAPICLWITYLGLKEQEVKDGI